MAVKRVTRAVQAEEANGGGQEGKGASPVDNREGGRHLVNNTSLVVEYPHTHAYQLAKRNHPHFGAGAAVTPW